MTRGVREDGEDQGVVLPQSDVPQGVQKRADGDREGMHVSDAACADSPDISDLRLAFDILKRIVDLFNDVSVRDEHGYCNFCFAPVAHSPDCLFVRAEKVVGYHADQ
jgi:hypothetical protein